jgi:translation initiation factor 5A
MDEGGETREDLRVPAGEVGDQLKSDFTNGKEVIATVTKAMESEVITGHACDGTGDA